jgi:hypothetical protein
MTQPSHHAGCLTVVRWIVTPAASARPSPVAIVSDGTPIPAKGDRPPSQVDNGALREAGLDALKKAIALSAISKRESSMML